MNSLAAPPPAPIDGAALFLDFDGTLVELADTPEAIEVPLHLPALLGRLRARLEGRLALVSGRSLADLERHLPVGGLACAGSHGLEIRFADGTALPLGVPPEMDEARRRVRAFADSEPGLIVEDKPLGIALHYRQAPQAASRVAGFAAELAARLGWVVQEGKMVAEVRPLGATKGDALRTLMAEPPFVGARPVFVGDDLTDEEAFSAAGELGGFGVLVGPPRATAARYRLDNVAAAAAWLEAAA